MKVLAINGSARINGNTDILIQRIFEKMKLADIETENIQFAGGVINPCKACFACGGKENCIHKKDRFEETFEKIKMADAIIIDNLVENIIWLMKEMKSK